MAKEFRAGDGHPMALADSPVVEYQLLASWLPYVSDDIRIKYQARMDGLAAHMSADELAMLAGDEA